MERMPRKKRHKSVRCTATSKRSGTRCRNWAVRGRSVCRMHGGAPGSGGQPGNRNARKHGLYEKFSYNRLTDTEKRLFDAIPSDSSLVAEVKLLRLLLLRLLGRLEMQVVVRTPAGAETVTLEVSEIDKIYCIAKVADGLRKLVANLNDGEKERFERLLAVLQTPAPGTREPV